jgi:N-acetylglucosamine malate deacetylase 1
MNILTTGSVSSRLAAESIPYLYYCEPFRQMDIFGYPVESSTYVEIDETFELKERMPACHASQRDFLKHRFGMDNYVAAMKTWSSRT